jgi:hypothetical protein
MANEQRDTTANRSDSLWATLFNAMPSRTPDGLLIIYSRRARMADAAWVIAQGATSDLEASANGK